MDGIDCYWWGHEPNPQNFGDIVTPYIVWRLSGRVPVNVLDQGGRYLCCGSILPDLKDGDIVWGSGLNAPEDIQSVPKDVGFCAVRGPLTRGVLVDRFGQDVPEIYGDPCLLIPRLLDISPPIERTVVGVVPHMLEYDTAIQVTGYPVINITSGFYEVIESISRCKLVISSSLHGLILADALGIPNVFAYFTHHDDLDSFTWKFYDYFLSVKRPLLPPLDCSKGIDTLFVAERLHKYSRIGFDYDKLLRSCPFRRIDNVW